MKILFSYHRHNIEWIDMFAVRLKPFYEKGQLSIIYDEVTESSKAFSVNQKELLSFDIIVFFISSKFISLNNFVGKEIPEMIPRFQKHGSRVIPVYLEDCSWQSIGWLREMKLWPSPQLPFSNMSEDEKEKHISRFIKDELKLAGAEDANQKNKTLDAHNALQNDFIKFLEKEKGYPRETMWTSNKGGVPDLSIIELGTKKPIVLIEFKVSNKQGVLGRAALDLLHYKKTREITDCFACIVCSSLGKSSEPFEIYEITDNGYESLFSMKDFPAYEDLRRKVGTKRQVSGGDDGSEGKFKEDEKRCIRIIAKWFRENKSLVNRDEAMNEFGVDNDRYDVLMKTMEHYGVVEKVESVMGKNGYAIAFWPSAYAEELARELGEEDERSNEGKAFTGMSWEKLKQDNEAAQQVKNEGGRKFEDWPDERKLRELFVKYLIEKKNYRREWLKGEKLTKTRSTRTELSVYDPEEKKTIAIIEFEVTSDREKLARAKEHLLSYTEVTLPKMFGYIVCWAEEKSEEGILIFEVEKEKELREVSFGDFPTFEEFKQRATGKKLTLFNFRTGLDLVGSEICDKIIDLAGDSNFGLYAEDVDESYANLRLEGSKKTDNVAVQIHKYGENENQIALAVVGPMKGVEVSELKLNDFIDKGKITELSGYKKNIPGEKAWLNGNLPKKGTREKATVYVIQREIVNIPELWNGVGEILNLGVENIGPPPKKEPEKPKIEPEALSVARSAVGDSETEDDKLGFEPYVEAVAEFLVHEDTQPPLTMSVEGEWGSGKSSFMRQLKKEVKRIYSEQGKKKCFIVDFDPWRHDKDEALWAAFVLKFIQDSASSLTKRERWDANYELWKQRFQWKKAWPDVMRVILISVVWVLATVAIAIGLWKGIKLGASGTVVVPKWIGSLIAVAISGWGAFGKVKDFLGSPLTVDLKKYMKKPDYVSKISFIEKFHKDFEKIVQSYAGNERVYVFIDDLDRCRVPKAAELMESINLMLSDNPKLVFIMGMDREKVAAGLVVKHEKLLPYLSSQVEVGSGSGRNDTRMRGIRYGYSFIEKFIQIPFILPIPSSYDIENMLLEIAGEKRRPTEPVKKIEEPPVEEPPVEEPEPKPDVPSKETKEVDRAERKEIRKEVMLKFEGDDKNFRSVVLMVSEAFGNNPRRVKQFVSLFRLRIRIAASTGLIKPEERQLTFVQLGKFVGIGLGWPLLIRDIERRPALLEELVEEAEGRTEGEANEKKKPKANGLYFERWSDNEKLMELLKAGCENEKDADKCRSFSLKGLDVKKLLQVAPRVMSVEEEMV